MDEKHWESSRRGYGYMPYVSEGGTNVCKATTKKRKKKPAAAGY
jgi:hypothetical protein